MGIFLLPLLPFVVTAIGQAVVGTAIIAAKLHGPGAPGKPGPGSTKPPPRPPKPATGVFGVSSFPDSDSALVEQQPEDAIAADEASAAAPVRVITSAQFDAAHEANSAASASLAVLPAIQGEEKAHAVLESFLKQSQDALNATQVGLPWDHTFGLAQTATGRLQDIINLFADPAFVKENQQPIEPAVVENLQTGLASWAKYLGAMSA